MDSTFASEHALLSNQRAIKEAAAQGDSPIQKFYEGSIVLVTGGSGFLGKLLIEKLIRTCAPSKIYVLIRHKKNETPKERIVEVLNDPLFDELRKDRKNFDKTVFPVLGNVEEIKLGLEELDWEKLSKEVNVIFHLAANVRFDVELKTALLSNARGTREALRLARDCTHLRAFVYVSTAYSHATQDRIDDTVSEVFYDIPIQADTMLKLAETLSNTKINKIKPAIADGWPNTYTFSKAIAEDIIRTNSFNLPICIVRPAIVTCTYLDPVPGWVDLSCAYGPSGLILGLNLGVMHIVYADLEVRPSLVPADIVNNSIIVAAWETAQQRNDGPPMIYTKPLRLNLIKKVVSTKAIWYMYGLHTKYKLLYNLITIFLHYVPAYIMDIGSILLRKPQRLVKTYKKVDKLSFALSYFTTRQWMFKDDNLQSLYLKLSPADKLIFNMDITVVNWQTKVWIWCLGIQKYIIKDTQVSTKSAYRKQKVLRVVHYLTYSVGFYLMWRLINFVINLFSSFNDVL